MFEVSQRAKVVAIWSGAAFFFLFVLVPMLLGSLGIDIHFTR